MKQLSLALIACASIALARRPEDEAARFFDSRVAPILSRRCLACHNEELKDGGVSFLDRDSLIRGGRRGPAIVPGDPERSVLIQTIRHNGDVKMPPGPKLSARDIATLTDWVRRGAPWGTKLRR
ncbi:MAG TPA: c-type cytochrome domain-containing protein [Bryobacteraceae bacterium]|nr:c-type cytochrome domain-containing protein [Bryobacteraceae bacterium]